MTDLIPYKKLYRIELNFDDRVHFIEEDKYLKLKPAINNLKFIEVGDSLISVSSIKKISPDKSGLGYVPEHLREPMKCEIARHKKMYEKYPTKRSLRFMLERVSKIYKS